MRLGIIYNILVFLTTSCSSLFCPEGIRIRKEFRDMTIDEWKTLKSALYTASSNGEYDRWTQMHLRYSHLTHNSPLFFPWHRWFLLEFETSLRKYNANITFPYWDWSFDSQDPLSSPIFHSQYLFMNTGPRGDCTWKRKYNKPHCLVRNYDAQKFSTFHDPITLKRIVSNAHLKYDEFRKLIEPAPHGRVHASIGGRGGDMTYMISPNDPIFWLHHGFIDKLWSDHQKISNVIYDYGGQRNSISALLSDPIVGSNLTVYDVMDMEKLCYAYMPFSKAVDKIANLTTEIKSPKPLPEDFIEIHGFNSTEVRSQESMFASMVNEVNDKIRSGRKIKYFEGQMINDATNLETLFRSEYIFLIIFLISFLQS